MDFHSIRILCAATTYVFYLDWIASTALPLGALALIILGFCNSESTLKIWLRKDRSLEGLVDMLAAFPVWHTPLHGVLLQTFLDHRLVQSMLDA